MGLSSTEMSPCGSAWPKVAPAVPGLRGPGLVPPDFRSKQELVVSVVCSSSVKAQHVVMLVVEGIHLRAARYHPLCSQSTLKTW